MIKPIKKSKIEQLDLLVLTVFYFPLREETIAGPQIFDFMPEMVLLEPGHWKSSQTSIVYLIARNKRVGLTMV